MFFESNNLTQTESYLFGIEHIIFMVLAAAFCITVPILLRKSKKQTLDKIFIGLWIFLLVSEFAKIAGKWAIEGAMPVTTNIPLHICSYYLLITPFAIWGKGKIKQIACCFICTMGLFGGLINFVYPTALMDSPFFNIFTLHTLIYHVVMVFTSALMWISGYYKPKFSDFYYQIAVLAIISIPAIIVDYIWHFDYIFYYSGAGTPLTIISSAVPSWAYVIILFLGYNAVNFLLFFLPILIYERVKAKKKAEL